MPIRIDASEGLAAAGFLSEVSLQIGTPQYIGPVLKFVHAELSAEFNRHMDTLAPAHPERYHHVYEWEEIGSPTARLWRNILVGGGATRYATWEWLASKTVVPVVQPDAIAKGVKAIHVFTWKAPVMEYDTNLEIGPQRGKGIAYFTGPQTPEDKWTLKFSRDPIVVQYPGGEAVKGAFTDEYVAWWGGEGFANLFDSKIRRVLEQDLKNMPLQSASGEFRAGTRSRSKTFGITTAVSASAAEAIGRAKATAWLQSRARKYINGAIAREGIGYGGLSE